MTEVGAADPRYPIGKFEAPPSVDAATRAAWIAEVEAAPERLAAAARGLSDSQLDTPYRDGGWTVRQVLHHVPDSHVNAYVRMKLAATEDEPTICPYDENAWVALPDATGDVAMSLELLRALHARWVVLLRGLDDASWSRAYLHPVNGKTRLDRALGLYAWHGNHHAAHVTALRARMGW